MILHLPIASQAIAFSKLQDEQNRRNENEILDDVFGFEVFDSVRHEADKFQDEENCGDHENAYL